MAKLVPRKSGSFPSFMTRKTEMYLPTTNKPQSSFRMKSLLGHCLYRRVVIWTVVVIVLLSITMLNPQINTRTHDVLDLVKLGKGDTRTRPQLSVDEAYALQEKIITDQGDEGDLDQAIMTPINVAGKGEAEAYEDERGDTYRYVADQETEVDEYEMYEEDEAGEINNVPEDENYDDMVYEVPNDEIVQGIEGEETAEEQKPEGPAWLLFKQ
jgi:hypothetical protein